MPGDLQELTGANAAPGKLAGGFGSVDGPVFSRRGYLLFSDTTTSRIMKWEEGKVSVFRENSPNAGLTFDHQGRLLACERERVTRTEKNGKITVLADQLHAPHDLVYAIDGSIYFSDAAPAPGAPAIYQITRQGKVRVVSRDCALPSGVALAPNQQKLYAGDTLGGKIWVYEIAGDGALRGGRLFARAPARGLKTDEGGNVWAAQDHAIAVFDAEGRGRGEIPLPEDPSNCAWGDGFRNLYVTAETSIYKIETKVNGTRTY
ncbi:MAG: SMP-30/gluconolactonase/LRE family protein [Terriglobia bacterium]